MAERTSSYAVILAASALVVASLLGGTAVAQDYTEGDFICGVCHTASGIFPDYRLSGHPYKLTRTGGLEPGPDTWPFTAAPWLPASLSWSDVEFVIGNYFWKARFVKTDGYIYTGDDAQFNLGTREQVPYHSGEVKAYSCGKCHTTGFSPDGHQLGLEGIEGTWVQEGIRCEACHGPGQDHVDNFGSIPPPGGKDCDDCHFRDAQFRMEWKGGFTRHHQQAEDFSHSPHWFFSCTACHDPHKSVVYGLGGIKADKHCTNCHDESEHQVPEEMAFLDCIDCHMPFMGKSAVAYSDYEADVRAHLFRITDQPIAAVDNTYEADGKTFWNQEPGATNPNGDSFITLDYACLHCHEDEDLAWAAEYAEGIHQRATSTDPIGDILVFLDNAVAQGDIAGVGPSGLLIFQTLLELAQDAHANAQPELAFLYLVFAYAGADGDPFFLEDLVTGPATPELLGMVYDALFAIW